MAVKPNDMGHDSSVLNLRYTGARFNDSAIPLSVLGELGALQKALNDIYKAQYYAVNHGRKRVPRGYKDALVLSLVAIEKGSAVACLERPRPHQLALDEELSDALGRSVQAFLDFIDSQGEAEADIRKAAIACVKELGASLKGDEAIVLERGERKIRYNQELRKKLLAQQNQSFTWTGEQVFTIAEVNKASKTFELWGPDGTYVRQSYDVASPIKEAVFEAFGEYESPEKNIKVMVSGQFTHDRNGVLSKVALDGLEVLGDRDLRWRIPYLRHRNAENKDILATLDRFEHLWESSISRIIPEHPALYILDDDFISAEWDAPNGEVSLSFSEDGLNVISLSQDLEQSFTVDQAEDAARLVTDLLSPEAA